MRITNLIFIFFFGLTIGSFLNVLIYRLPRGLNIVKGRSFCPKCKKQLVWWELIPLFSFLFLRGRCSKCRAWISWQYPIVEFSTGSLFVLLFLKYISFANYELRIMNYEFLSLMYGWIIISILIAIFFIDLKHYIIPDSLIIIGAVVAIIFLVTTEALNLRFETLNVSVFPWLQFSFFSSQFLNHLIFAIIGGGLFGLIILLTRGKGMGIGDMKFAVLMGLILGNKLIPALYFSFIIGAVAGILLMIFKKKTLKSKLPFGPFLVASTLALMLL